MTRAGGGGRSNGWSRRDFLAAGAAAATAGFAAAGEAGAGAAGARESEVGVGRGSGVGFDGGGGFPPIVDTHQHLWELSRFRLAWIARGSRLDRDFDGAAYAAATRGLGVSKAIYMEVDVPEDRQGDELDWIAAVCEAGDTPTVAAVVSGRPESEGFGDWLDRLGRHPRVKGIRRVLHGGTPAGHCLSETFVKNIRALGARGLRFDLCMRAAELGDGEKLVSACPETRFVLDHCGNPNIRGTDAEVSAWKREIDKLAAHDRVAAKISGIGAGLRPGEDPLERLGPFAGHVMDAFGPDRVVFGGDWPVCTLGISFAIWVETARRLLSERGASAEEARKLFHDNAARFYELD